MLRSPAVQAALLLASGALAALAFIALAFTAGAGGPLAIDRVLSGWARQIESPVLDALMRALTLGGSFTGVASLLAFFASWSVRRGRWRLAVLVAAAASVAEGLNELFKLVFQRARPMGGVVDPLPATYSFPSGHALVSTVAYGLAALIVARLYPRLRPLVLAATPLWLLLIGFSRVYLGVHWPTDVLAGFAAGGLLLLAGWVAARRILRRPDETRSPGC